MAENEDLEVLGSVGSTRLSGADEETDEGADDEVKEGEHRPMVPGLLKHESGFPTRTGVGLIAGAVLLIPWLVGVLVLSVLVWLTNPRRS